MSGPSAARMIDGIYEELLGSEDVEGYHERHDTASLVILTQTNRREAEATAVRLYPFIYRKRVVEVGAGVGFLAVAMAKHAASVIAIEADPASRSGPSAGCAPARSWR